MTSVKKTQTPGGRRKNRNGNILTKEQEKDIKNENVPAQDLIKEIQTKTRLQHLMPSYAGPQMRTRGADTQSCCKGKEKRCLPLGEKLSKFRVCSPDKGFPF